MRSSLHRTVDRLIPYVLGCFMLFFSWDSFRRGFVVAGTISLCVAAAAFALPAITRKLQQRQLERNRSETPDATPDTELPSVDRRKRFFHAYLPTIPAGLAGAAAMVWIGLPTPAAVWVFATVTILTGYCCWVWIVRARQPKVWLVFGSLAVTSIVEVALILRG